MAVPAFRCPPMAVPAFRCLLLLLTVTTCQGINVSGVLSYSSLCNRWNLTAKVTMTPAEMNKFDAKVTVQTAAGDWTNDGVQNMTRVCEVDLRKSPPICATPHADMCDFISKTDDVYHIVASRSIIDTSQRGMDVQVMLQTQSGDRRVLEINTVGQLPENISLATQPEVTYQLNGETVVNINDSHRVAVTACKHQFIPLKFCALEPREKSVLKIFSDDVEVKSNPPCIETGFRLRDSKAKTIKFQYEDTMCLLHKIVTMTVTEREPESCGVYTPTNACRSRPGYNAREIVKISSGVSKPIDVMCDTESDGGGWIVFQRRTSVDVDFYRGWNEYRKGFGDLTTNFWLGLDTVHSLCNKTGTCDLRVDIRYKGSKYYAQYENFFIDGPRQNYRLHVGTYSGDAGDSLSYHNNKPFTTKDKDNDEYGSNCAVQWTGAWWYKSCHHVNLNGVWGAGGSKGLKWSQTTNSKPPAIQN